jgi:hypothetical protein
MKKIMFSERYGLEQAVLAGTKTMTRRVITIPEKWHGIEVYGFCHVKGQAALELTDGDDFCIEDQKTGQCAQILPTYRIGEEVAIAQAYQTFRWPALPGIDWKAITDEVTHSKGWKNKMYVKANWMPHRIRITGIKVERLQDIREEDCLREGIKKMEEGMPYRFDDNGKVHLSADPRMLFADLIDRISGRGTWQSNPWVYAYEFELVR